MDDASAKRLKTTDGKENVAATDDDVTSCMPVVGISLLFSAQMDDPSPVVKLNIRDKLVHSLNFSVPLLSILVCVLSNSPSIKLPDGLSPDQKKRMNENKVKAEIKLQSKKTPALHSNMGTSWFMALKQEFSKPYFDELSKFLDNKRNQATVYPPADQVFSWTHHTDLEDIKVVILGQDPYHGVKQAHGLCFSVQKGIAPPPSLLNMYKELEDDIPGFTRPSHGHLIGWAKQGVLLLNACLTVTAHQANSHKDRGWEKFTDAVIMEISKRNFGVVFLLWGSYAQKKAAVVDKKKHHLLCSTHPSPLSAHRGFLGCKHFSKCNELLKKGGKKPIDWGYLPLEL